MFPWQVFGLTGSYLLARLPKRHALSVVVAFVPAYRCGAVPESHRIPSSFSGKGETIGMTLPYLGGSSGRNTTYCGNRDIVISQGNVVASALCLGGAS